MLLLEHPDEISIRTVIKKSVLVTKLKIIVIKNKLFSDHVVTIMIVMIY